jgi:hypothetical protein
MPRWSDDEIKVFEKYVGKVDLLDEDGDDWWAFEMVSSSEVKKDTFTDAEDLAKNVLDDINSGDFTVEDIYNKYLVNGFSSFRGVSRFM